MPAVPCPPRRLPSQVIHVAPHVVAGVGDGTAGSPWTLAEAIASVRATPPATRPATTILLGGGRYQLHGDTIELGAGDGGRAEANVVWAAAPGEVPVISGATRLELVWTEVKGVFSAKLPGDLEPFKSIYVGGQR